MRREERLAANEALFREVNKRIEEVGDRFGLEVLDLVCECADIACTQLISVSQAEYEALRASGVRFGVAPGHELPDVEQIVERHNNYLVVQKIGVGAEVAEELAPAEPSSVS